MIVQKYNKNRMMLQGQQKNLTRRNDRTVYTALGYGLPRKKTAFCVKHQKNHLLLLQMTHLLHKIICNAGSIFEVQGTPGGLTGNPSGKLRNTFELYCFYFSDTAYLA